MPCNYAFPKPESIRQIIADLLGREITITKAAAAPMERDTPAVVSDYVDGQGAIAAVCITDLRLSNALGAALTMVPPSSVDAAVQKGQIEEANLENLSEIANILARLFNHDDCAHLRWQKAHPLPGELPEGTSALIKAPLARRDFDVMVEEYGSGSLAVLVG